MRVVGVGARRGVTTGEVLAAVDAVGGPVDLMATLAGKAVVVEAAHARNWPVLTYPGDVLAAVPTPTTSARVLAAVGTGSVAEAAALAGGGELVVPRVVHGRVTVAVAVR